MATPILFVVVGAGASFDCADGMNVSVSPTWRPPLVTQLFEHRFDEVLRQYPLVQAAAAEIRNATGSSLSLEDFLNNTYRESTDVDDQRIFRLLPLYLQHLLFVVGRDFTSHPDRYDLLISGALRA